MQCCPDKKAGQMTTKLDIYRTASILIREHGEDAAIHAAMRADELLDRGDLDGSAVWRKVKRAVEELLREAAREDETVH